jgi:hypothetical protein
MGNRTRLPDMLRTWRNSAEAAAARAEAEATVERWQWAISTGRDIWWPPTIRCAVVAAMPWLDVYCPGCHTSRSIDIRTIDEILSGTLPDWRRRSSSARTLAAIALIAALSVT